MFVGNPNSAILQRSNSNRNHNHMEQRATLFDLGEFTGRYRIVPVRIKSKCCYVEKHHEKATLSSPGGGGKQTCLLV